MRSSGRELQVHDVSELGDLLDVGLARSESILDHDTWTALASLRGRLRRRTGFLGDVLVVALAGGTGSGKSSLLNALCRSQIAQVGIERPTTSECLAVIPSNVAGDLAGFVESLGIDTMVTSPSLDALVLVDLPDFDSTFANHREIVESVLDVVDAVIWVFDPEKYADRLMHDSFLRPLRDHEHQMLFVLNQADRLGEHVEPVRVSLEDHLRDDGFTDPHVVMTVAAGSETVDVSTDELESALARQFDTKESAIRTLATDIGAVANQVWKQLDASFGAMVGAERHDTSLAMASFVSLGIAAYDVARAGSGRDRSDELE